MTASLSSGSIMKLPGCGSACSRPTASGAEKWKRPISSATRFRRSLVPAGSAWPALMIADTGVPSSHSLTITFGALATTFGITISGCPS
ncbi:Uncharacterised protein [Mycobacteroides abscessus subsp. abscessus]|nr:Uncharacterised protein [Mycobacteroides abscessus subsp. abscessus]